MISLSGKRDKISDEELLKRYLSTGNRVYIGKLYERKIPMVYGVCLKYLGNKQDAEDAVMNIYEHVCLSEKRFRISQFDGWLYTVVKNHCLQVLRAKKVNFTEIETLPVMESDEVLHLLNREGEEKLRDLENCLGQLPPPQRESVKLFFYEEKSYADITDITGYNIKSVKSYIQNGKRNLKNCMEKVANKEWTF